jgi:DNA polymerase V
VWGIGRRHAKRLMALGIKNAYQFTQLPDQWVRKNMSIVGLRLKHELEGKLHRQKSSCNALLIFLHTNGFRSDLPQYSRNIVMKLPFPTNSSIEIAKFAVEGLSLIFKQGYQYKKAGVIVMDITPEETNQISMFENTNPKHKLLMDVMDRLNSAIGQKKVKLASQALDRTWKMKQERLSPRYTTRLSEIIIINA